MTDQKPQTKADVIDLGKERKTRRPGWEPVNWPRYFDGRNVVPLTASGKAASR